jgi:hypothetical protein
MKYLIPLLLFPLSCFAQLSETPRQSAVGDTGNATAASFTVTMSSAPLQGNVLIMGVVSGASGLRVTSNNTRWILAAPLSYNSTEGGGVQIWLGYVDASAGTVVTINAPAGAVSAQAAVLGEYTGVNLQADSISGNASGNSTSPAVTIAASNRANVLQVACISTRGTWSAQNATYSAPTNSFKFVDGTTGATGVAQRNTIINTSSSDRAVTLLVKVVADGASVSAGATQALNQWTTVGISLAEVQRGFITAP